MTSAINFREYLQYWTTLYLLNLAINKRSRRMLSPSALSALWGWGKNKRKRKIHTWKIHMKKMQSAGTGRKKKSKNKNHAHMENCKLQTAPHPLHIWSLPTSICMFSKVSFLWRLTKQINYCKIETTIFYEVYCNGVWGGITFSWTFLFGSPTIIITWTFPNCWNQFLSN